MEKETATDIYEHLQNVCVDVAVEESLVDCWTWMSMTERGKWQLSDVGHTIVTSAVINDSYL